MIRTQKGNHGLACNYGTMHASSKAMRRIVSITLMEDPRCIP